MIDNTRGCITEHCTYRVCITGHPSKVTILHGTPGLSAFRLSDTHHWYHTYTLHDAWASLPIVNRGSPRFSHALPAPQHASPSVSQRACALASRTVARFSDDLMDRSLTHLASGINMTSDSNAERSSARQNRAMRHERSGRSTSYSIHAENEGLNARSSGGREHLILRLDVFGTIPMRKHLSYLVATLCVPATLLCDRFLITHLEKKMPLSVALVKTSATIYSVATRKGAASSNRTARLTSINALSK